jgi:hypothetical protein
MITFEVDDILHETNLAYYLNVILRPGGTPKPVWIPKSRCKLAEPEYPGQNYRVTMESWLARDKGLL